MSDSKTMTRVWWLVPGVALTVLLTVTYLLALPVVVKRQRRSPCEVLRPVAPPKAPELGQTRLADVEGNIYQLSHFRGRFVLLNFWLTTCEPCIEEIPSLLELAARYQQRGFVLLFIATDPELATVIELIQRAPKLRQRLSNVLYLHDPGGKILGKRLGTTKYPESYMISTEGKLLAKVVGKRHWSRAASAACIARYLP